MQTKEDVLRRRRYVATIVLFLTLYASFEIFSWTVTTTTVAVASYDQQSRRLLIDNDRDRDRHKWRNTEALRRLSETEDIWFRPDAVEYANLKEKVSAA